MLFNHRVNLLKLEKLSTLIRYKAYQTFSLEFIEVPRQVDSDKCIGEYPC
jgi:hypothetical protein